MKTSFKILTAAALLLAFSFNTYAQRGERPTAAQQAERQTTHMVEALGLDEAQTTSVQAINLRYAEKMQEAREDNKGDRDAMKEIGAAIRTEKAEELKTVLTEEQFAKLQEMEKEGGNRGRRRGPRGGSRG